MSFRKILPLIALVLVIAAIGIFATRPHEKAPAECAPVQITVDSANSVHGLKDGGLFAYVDLAGFAQQLACHTDAEIQDAVITQLTPVVETWWKEPRLSKAPKAQVHIITILDKDEYAQANFNSALMHGKIDFIRKDGKVQAQPVTLAFDNMRKGLAKKH